MMMNIAQLHPENEHWYAKADYAQFATPVERALFNLDKAIKEIEAETGKSVDAIIGMMSSGIDSAVATYIASNHPQFYGVGMQKPTRDPINKSAWDYVRDVCSSNNWKLFEAFPPTGHSLQSIIVENGIPSPNVHSVVQSRLKGRPTRAIHRMIKDDIKSTTLKKSPLIVFISGARSSESATREKNTTLWSKTDFYHIAPIHDWTRKDCLLFMKANSIPVNETAMICGRSKECSCEANGNPQENELKFNVNEKSKEWHRLNNELARIAKELHMLEYESGTRSAKELVIRETELGHGNLKRSKKEVQKAANEQTMNFFDYCHSCVNTVDQDGKVRENPDHAILIAKLKRYQETGIKPTDYTLENIPINKEYKIA